MSIKTVRNALFGALMVVLAVAVALIAVVGWLGRSGDFSWSVTPLGWLLMAGSAGLLMVLLAVTLARAPRTSLTVIAIVAGHVAVPLLSFGAGSVMWECFAIGVVGVLALEAGGFAGALRSNPPRMVGFEALVVVTVLLIVGGVLVMGLMGLTSQIQFAVTTSFLSETSPSGPWSLTGEERDEGALGGSVTIVAHRTYWGVIERSRVVYSGDWGVRPRIRWLDRRTVALGGRTLDIYLDPTIYGYR